MERIKEWIQKNKREVIAFFSGVLVFFAILGIFFTVKSMTEKEKKEVEVKQTEKEKKIEQKNKEKEEVPPEEVQESGTNNKETQTSNSAPIPNQRSEEDVVEYFSMQEKYAEAGENNATAREQLKNSVNTIYQFLFQGGTIYGKTFSELSSSAKLKVLKIALSIDQKIDAYFPNYKDKIKEGASNLKAKIVVTYLETTNKICENHEDVCNQAREDFKTMKNSFKISFSLISELVKSGGTAIKEWYLSTK